VRPTIYCSRFSHVACLDAIEQHYPGLVQLVDFWLADWTNAPHLLAGTVATQYASPDYVPPGTLRPPCDVSVVRSDWSVLDYKRPKN
jgi:hypothetical protein